MAADHAQGRVRALREKLSIQRLYQYPDDSSQSPTKSPFSTPLPRIPENEKSKENESAVRKRIAQLEGVAAPQKTSQEQGRPSPPRVGALVARFDPHKDESPTKKKEDERASNVTLEKAITTKEKEKPKEPEIPPPFVPAPKPKTPPIAKKKETKEKKKEAQEDKMAENELEGVTIQLADILRTPEDLEKIPAIKAEIMRKKAAVDAQLMEGLKEQLEATQSGMSALKNGQDTLNQIKEEMMNIDRLCREAKGMIQDGALPNLELIARTQRNFAAVEKMKNDLETFNDRLAEVEQLISADDQDMENQPNLLPAHYKLTKLRDIRDDAIDQIRRANDPSSEATLQDYFSRLDEVIEWFDDHIGTTCMQLIPMVQADNRGLVVRLAVVVAEEEKGDLKVKALQDASKDHKELAERFKSINTGPKQVRGYKEKFLKCIEFYAQQQFEATEEAFLEDPSKLEKSFKWFFNDLFVVKQGMQKLMPKKWKIFKTYADIYHKLMHDWLIKFIADPELRPPVMLAIVHWTEKYYGKMKKLGWQESDLQPHVLDNREAELVGEWRQLIVKTVEEWMDRMYLSDRKAMLNRNPDALDTDANGLFRTKTLGDMWRMLREQTIAAGDSERMDVTEGVVDAMFRALKSRQPTWEKLIDEETSKYKTSAEAEGLQPLQDWLVAIANDQISCIDDNASSGQQGYLTRFKRDFENLVTPKYMASAENEVESIRGTYVDLSAHCMTRFVITIFNVDCRSTLPDFFTPKWYPEYAMKRIITTFEDYVGDYAPVLYTTLLDIFLEEISEELLVRYLSSVRNKGAKFRRQDPFHDKFREDISTIFEFFSKWPGSFDAIKQRWRVVDYLVRLLESDKASIVVVYEEFKNQHWDLQLSWVEAVLRSRDDFDRTTLNAVKARAAEMYVDRREETVMSKVR
jgi:exocyst complex component 3